MYGLKVNPAMNEVQEKKDKTYSPMTSALSLPDTTPINLFLHHEDPKPGNRQKQLDPD